MSNPEFLREGTAIHDFEEPPFTILGTENVAVQETLRSIYSDLSAPIFLLKPKGGTHAEVRQQRLPCFEGRLR